MIANIDCTATDYPITLDAITTATNAYAIAHEDLSDTVRALEAELAEVKSRHLKQLRKDVARAADKRSALATLLERSPQLFEKPRTLTINGIKVGYQKGKGRIEFDDADHVILRIQRTYGDQADAYLNMKITPNKEALAQLPVADLKKLGCTVTDAGDEIVIKPTNDVDKIVTALLKDACEA
jgi:hypothetical protein